MDIVLKFQGKKFQEEHPLALGSMINIGRSREASIKLQDERISSSHCRLMFNKDRLEIHDLDSKNGTYLNGIRIDRSDFFIGDEIRIGSTIITLVESKMPPHMVSILTFPGPNADRLSHELKADFTGVRIQNQLYDKDEEVRIIDTPSHDQEIALRKKAHCRIKLSKEEIRHQHRVLSIVTTVLDLFLLVAAFLFPLAMFKRHIYELAPEQPILAMGISMMASGLLFRLINLKATKFTLGERFTGIRDLYLKQ